MNFKDELIKILSKSTKLSKEDINKVLSVPPDPKLGDFAFPCFIIGKKMKCNPNEAAEKLQKKLKLPEWIEKAKVTGPYLNFYLKLNYLAKEIILAVQKQKEDYGKQNFGKDKTIVIDYSSPNIAKPFGIGHLRSTIIGSCLANVNRDLGYKVVRVNHLGDWGTQFGKMIVAYKMWGQETELKKDPINYLLSLYVRFHDEAEKDDSLNEDGREAFKKLEEGDAKYLELWQKFRDLSLKEFNRMYDLLGVKFDSFNGEAFYNDKTQKAIENLQKKIETKISEGALVVDLEEYNMPPVLLRKSDGSTMYHTRDIAAIFYRMKTFNPSRILYVVGSPQQMHFKQLFKTMELWGYKTELFEHVGFGLIKLPSGKMSTRKGKLILLEEVIEKAIEKVQKVIEEKNPNLKDKKQVAKQIGIGAIIFADLRTDRLRDVVFDWDKILSFEGETGPYLQYTHARACSILRKARYNRRRKVDYSRLSSLEAKQVILEISKYTEILKEVSKQSKPHILANYLIRFAQLFNEFYVKNKVIVDDEKLMNARLALVDSMRQVLANGLEVLGIAAPEEM